MKKKPTTSSQLSKNKKAFHDYEILEQFEAGIILNGDEVKSIKAGQANLKGGFIDVQNEKPYLNEIHVSRYKNSSRPSHNPSAKRELLLHKKETANINAQISQKGVTAIPLELYLKGGLIKLKIGICRGKKLYDKRETLKRKDQNIEINRQLKGHY